MSKLVLITGINGFVAGRTAEAFLKAGYAVRGTARSVSSTRGVVEALSKWGRVEVVEVADVTAPGAFDKAVQGVTHIAHLASPLAFAEKEPEPIIKQAVHGTTEVLQSALSQPQIQAVVVMSSNASMRYDKGTPVQSFDETDWNLAILDTVAKLGNKANHMQIYSASKVRAEQALWDFVKEKKPHFSVAAINPGFIAGPPVTPVKSQSDVPQTDKIIFGALTGAEKLDSTTGQPVGPSQGMINIDVRDVARVVLWAAENGKAANGQRYLLMGGYLPSQAIHDILREAYPDRKDIISEGKPKAGYAPNFGFAGAVKFDTSKVEKATGQGWMDLKQTVLEAAKAFEPAL
jgi:nucleoside-diphosphate-sugar epimerase